MKAFLKGGSTITGGARTGAGMFGNCKNLDGKHHSLVEIGEPAMHLYFYWLVVVAAVPIYQLLLLLVVLIQVLVIVLVLVLLLLVGCGYALYF